MISEAKFKKIKELLYRDYPNVETPLVHSSAFELLVATILSAQTLDTTVNKKTPALFKNFKTVADFAKVTPEDLAPHVSGINYYYAKSKNLVKMANMLLDKFNGEVPSTIEELTELPGVGRKTANVVINEWFSKRSGKLPEGFVVDTHVLRVGMRLGLTKNTDAEKVEQDMMKIFPQKEWDDWSLRMILHGRYMCKARGSQCINDPEWSKICGCVNEVKTKTQR
jgi:endonuclease-3